MQMTTHNFGRQIGVLARLWRTELDNRLRPLGLSQARWVLLVYLNEAPEGLAQLELAEQAGVSGPTLVRQIDQLENAGLVVRSEHPNDRRSKRVCLTVAGRKKFEDVHEIAGGLRHEVLANEDPADVDAMVRLAGRLIGRFDVLSKTPAQEEKEGVV